MSGSMVIISGPSNMLISIICDSSQEAPANPPSRTGQKEPEPRNRTEITENRNQTNRTEGTVMKFGSGFLRTEINEIF
jgi:hypothetical protein